MGTTTDLLFASGVLTEREGDLTLSPAVEETVEEYETHVSGLGRPELAEYIHDRIGNEAPIEPLADLGLKDPRMVAELSALADAVEAPVEEWLPLLPVLRLVRTDHPPTRGVPLPFIPVPGDLVPNLARIYARLLVYIWLDDCPPCDALKERLETVFDGPTGVLLVAVYGPDHKEFLASEYDVTGGPALLFMRDGDVDSRLYGDQDERVIANEVERILA